MKGQDGKEDKNFYPIFNYSTINVFLQKSTQALIVELNRPHYENRINSEMLFELETLFSWVPQHLEIQSILLTSSSSYLGPGLDENDLKLMNQSKLQRFLQRIQRLILSFFHLPQTLVVDLKRGAKGISLELAIGADIRICHDEAHMEFDHLTKGLTPCCGGIGMLGLLIPKTYLKNWILSSMPIPLNELLQSGFIHQCYSSLEQENDSLVSKLLGKIKDQAPIQRIQSKRSLLEGMTSELYRSLEWEEKIGHGGLFANDWKEHLLAQEENRSPIFTDPRDLARILKELKINNQEDSTPLKE